MRGLTSAKSRRYDFLPSYDAVGCPSALAFHDYQPLFTQCSQIPSYGTLADTGVRRDRGDGHALAFGEHVDDCGIYRVSPIFHLRVRLTRPRCGAHPSLGAQTPLQYEVCLIHCLRIGHPREHRWRVCPCAYAPLTWCHVSVVLTGQRMTETSHGEGRPIRPQRGESVPLHDKLVIRWNTLGY